MLVIFSKGGIIMWPLLFCSFLGTFIIIQKLLFFRLQFSKMNKKKSSLYLAIKDIHQDEEQKLKHSSLLLHHCAYFAKLHANNSPEVIQFNLSNFMTTKSLHLDKGMSFLSALITITPILGLTGTVLGLMEIFKVLSNASITDTTLLSAGIAEALITTVSGLVIAIPFILMHHLLSQKIEHYSCILENSVHEFLNFFKSN